MGSCALEAVFSCQRGSCVNKMDLVRKIFTRQDVGQWWMLQ